MRRGMPARIHSTKHRRHQQDANCQTARDPGRLQSLLQRRLHGARKADAHRVINTRAGQQRNAGDDQIGRDRALAPAPHALGIHGGHNLGKEVGAVDTEPGPATQQVHDPCQRAAERAQNAAPVVDVKQDHKSQTGDKRREPLRPERIGQRRSHLRMSVDRSRNVPRRRRAERDGERREQHLHDAADAGTRVAVDNITHGVRNEQPGHQQHQRADDDDRHTVEPAEAGGDIRRQRHEKGRRNGAEKRVDLQPVHAARHKADDQAAQPCPEPIAHRAAKHAAKARRRHEIAEVIRPHSVAADGGRRFLEPALRLLRFRHLGADAPAERVELFNALEIIAVVAHALHNGQRLGIRRHKADRNAVRDGKCLALRAIGLDHTAHGLLDPVRLRPGDRELVADLHRHIRKKIIVHTCLPISKNFPAKAGLPALRA